MKRKATDLTIMEEKEEIERSKLERSRRFVSFSKRRSGLFNKASEFCVMFDAQMAILVLSEPGRPYGFGSPSVEAVINRYMQFDEAPDSVSNVALEEQIHKFRGLKNRRQNKRKRESADVDDQLEDDYQLADVKERIEEELKACQTVEDMVSLRDKYSALLQNIKKRLKTSHVLEDGKAQYASNSNEPVPKFEDFWSNSNLSFESDHQHVGDIYNHNNNNDGEGSFWDKNLEDGDIPCVSIQPMSSSKDICYSSTPKFENDHGVDDPHGNNNGGDVSVWYKELEDGKVRCVCTQPWSSSNLNFEGDHVVDGLHDNNNNGGEASYWDKDLEDGDTRCVSVKPISRSKDICSCSTLKLGNDHRLVDDHHGGNNGGDVSVLYKELEDGKARCASTTTQPTSKSEGILSNSNPNFESDPVVDDHHGNNINGNEESSWAKSLENFLLGPDGSDYEYPNDVPPMICPPTDPSGHYSYKQDIINSPHRYQGTSFNC